MTLIPSRVSPPTTLLNTWAVNQSGRLVVGLRPLSAVVLAMVLMVTSSVLFSMNSDTKREHCSCQVLVFTIWNVRLSGMATANASRTARERVREEMTGRSWPSPASTLARDGAAALSIALHRPGPGHGPLCALPVLRRARRPAWAA